MLSIGDRRGSNAMGYCGWEDVNDHDETCPCFKKINSMNPTVKKRKDNEVT